MRISSLCSLCVLCASVVKELFGKNNHRDTEDTEIAQRNQTFRAKLIYRIHLPILCGLLVSVCLRRVGVTRLHLQHVLYSGHAFDTLRNGFSTTVLSGTCDSTTESDDSFIDVNIDG